VWLELLLNGQLVGGTYLSGPCLQSGEVIYFTLENVVLAQVRSGGGGGGGLALSTFPPPPPSDRQTRTRSITIDHLRKRKGGGNNHHHFDWIDGCIQGSDPAAHRSVGVAHARARDHNKNNRVLTASPRPMPMVVVVIMMGDGDGDAVPRILRGLSYPNYLRRELVTFRELPHAESPVPKPCNEDTACTFSVLKWTLHTLIGTLLQGSDSRVAAAIVSLPSTGF
jgi:hypothetical protein